MKTLVVAGASLGLSGCGGQSRRTAEGAGADAGGSGGSGAAGMTAGGNQGGASVAGFTGNVEGCPPAQRLCQCEYDPPLILDCTFDHPLGYLEGSEGQVELVAMACECDEARPESPRDCPHTQQFTCTEYEPEYEECSCNPNAPLSADDCVGSRYFQCAGSDPIIGCECVVGIK